MARRRPALVTALACAALSGGESARAAPPECATVARAEAPSDTQAWRAELHARAPVRSRLQTRASRSVDPSTAPALLVLAAPRAANGRCWVRVRLPSRPNDAGGWIAADRVQLSPTPWRIVVRRSTRRLEVYRDGGLLRRLRVVVGAPATPTPAGQFAVAQAWRWRPDDFLGAWILSLTAHSEVLQRFDGGDGRAALHGRGGASLGDPLGSARSHGCIRLANDAIGWLVRTIGRTRLPGTPVGVE